MAQTIKLRRSATPSAAPTTGQLELGELALNTYDGKMYMKKDDGAESIVEIGQVVHTHDGLAPAGGGAGQVLKKDTATDYDYSWQDDEDNGEWGQIIGTLSNQTDLQNALNAKADTSHNHDGTYEPAFSKNTAFNKNFGTVSGTVAEGDHLHESEYISIIGTPTTGNFPTMTAGGELVDSVYGPSSFEAAFTKNSAFNKDFGTGAGDVAEGDHLHPGVYLPIGGGTLTGALTLNADPTSNLHAATKQYVDNNIQGFSHKTSVRCATTANITLSGEQTLDGVTTSTDRVLVKEQTDASENGIYVSAAGAWTRATDADAWDELVSAFVLIEEGTEHADEGWVCTSDSGGTLGSTNVTWVQFSGGASTLAALTDTSISSPVDNEVLLYSSGSWINGSIPSGATSKTISSPGGWTLDTGDLYYNTFNHALGTTEITVFAWDDTTNKEIRFEDVEIVDTNNIRVYVRGNSHNDIKVNVVTGRGPSGAAGADGAEWFNGAGAPAGGTGVVGDYYINNSNGDYYEKTGTTTWTLRGNLEGPAGGVSSIDDLSDVDTTTSPPSVNDRLRWDGSDWVPTTPVAHVNRIGHTWAISGEIKVASGDTDFLIPFFVSLASGQTAKIVKARHVINSGTSATVKVQKNGADVTGFTGIVVGTTAGNTDPADVTIADDDKLALVVTAVNGTPKNMTFTLFLEYTV